MSYELTLHVHGADVEIEFDDLDELEAKLSALDVDGRFHDIISRYVTAAGMPARVGPD